jgi:hypothetical protein
MISVSRRRPSPTTVPTCPRTNHPASWYHCVGAGACTVDRWLGVLLRGLRPVPDGGACGALLLGVAVNDIVGHPFECTSDSFYFVENRLIMHNKASYK